jgi:hypothetical protein
VAPLPSRSGIYRLLKRHDQIDPSGRRLRSKKFKRWERGTAMELWQMDVVGGILLADGTSLKALTGIDDHSRFIVCAGLMRRENSRSVCGHLAESRPADTSAMTPVDRSTDDWIARRVSAVGVVCVAWQQISVGKHRAGRTVDVQVGEEILHIWDGNDLLKTVLRDNRKEIRKKKASVAS